jgi:hypothetical protein
MSPSTTPRKIAGNVGPPRKLPRETLHASRLTRQSGVEDSNRATFEEMRAMLERIEARVGDATK